VAVKGQTWQQWVRAVIREKRDNPSHPSRLEKHSLAALTGTDHRVLEAFVPLLKLYSYAPSGDVFGAMQIVLGQMQRSTLWIAKELIPFALEWHDRERLWPLIEPSPVRLVDKYGDPGNNPLDRSHP
jgi:hypothetical protein